MRTLALYWPTLSGLADRAERLRSARHALGRLSPLVAGRDSCGLIEVGIDGLQARSGSERDIAAIALRAVGVHLREQPTVAVASSRLLAVLVARGGVVASEEARQQLEERGLYIDTADADAFKKAVAGKMDAMVRGGSKLGQIAKAEEAVDANDVARLWTSLNGAVIVGGYNVDAATPVTAMLPIFGVVTAVIARVSCLPTLLVKLFTARV
jgi:hypothetical protein